MAIGFWQKLKNGFKRFAKGVKTVFLKILPIAQKVVPAIVKKFNPKAGELVEGGLNFANNLVNGSASSALKQGAGLAGIQLGDLANVKLRGNG